MDNAQKAMLDNVEILKTSKDSPSSHAGLSADRANADGMDSTDAVSNVEDNIAKTRVRETQSTNDNTETKSANDNTSASLEKSNATSTPVTPEKKGNFSEKSLLRKPSRSRSRSKSPRGKTSEVVVKEDQPDKKAIKPKAEKSKARKRKAQVTDKSKEATENGPRPKLAKTKKKPDKSLIKTEDKVNKPPADKNDDSKPKAKRKYVRKVPLQRKNTKGKNTVGKANILESEIKSTKGKETESSISTTGGESKPVQCAGTSAESEKKETASQDDVKNSGLFNGEGSATEIEKVRKKPGPKKGSKRKPKVNAPCAPSTTELQKTQENANDIVEGSTLKNGEVEIDSDTQDYNVNVLPVNLTPEHRASSNKKVVKIDDIEITELSDLNSSRDESAEENDMDFAAAKTISGSQQNRIAGDPPTFISLDACEQEDKTFMCLYPNCKYRGKARVLLRKHLSIHHIYLCAHCEFHCNVVDELETHMVANHPQRWGRKKCKKCQRYIKGSEFGGHEDACDGTKMFPCELCEKIFKYESKLQDHVRKFHTSVKCEHCEFMADNKSNLRKHITTSHRSLKKSQSTIVSPQIAKPAVITESENCKSIEKIDQTIVTAKSPVSAILLSPLDDAPKEDIDTKLETNPVISETPSCLITKPDTIDSSDDNSMKTSDIPSVTSIPVPFVEKESMQFTADSSGQVTLSIPDTAVLSETASSLTAAIAAADSASVPSCSLPSQSIAPADSATGNFTLPTPMSGCAPKVENGSGAQLMSPDSTTPMLFQPPLDGPCMCDVDGCGLMLKSSRMLINHKKSVHNMLPSQITFPCLHPDCNLRFKKKGQLKKHYVVHTGERKYICSVEGCGKAFRHNANLKIHNLLHTGEKPIKCKFCEFACRQKSSLIHHMKTKHKEIGWPIKNEDLPKDLQSSENAEDNSEDAEPKIEKDDSFAQESFEAKEEDADKVLVTGEGIAPCETLLASNEAQSAPPCALATPPKTLSTPTKAMVKAMTPGFLLAATGSKPLSPGAATKSPAQSKTDVYDFDDEDENLDSSTEFIKPSPKKSPKAKQMTADESVTPTKKKRGPKKKKDEKLGPGQKPDSPKGKKTTPKKKKNAADSDADAIALQSMEALAKETVAFMDEIDEATSGENVSQNNGSSFPDAANLEPASEHVSEDLPPMSATSSEYAGAVFDEADTLISEPEHAVFDDNMGPPHAPAPVYEHHDHSPLMDALESEDPSNQALPQLTSPLLSPQHEAQQQDQSPYKSEPLSGGTDGRNDDAFHKSPFSEISPVSQVASNENRAISSVNSMQSPVKEPTSVDQTTPLDMHVPLHRGHGSFDLADDVLSPHKKINSSFELPNDMDPDEAAKILEESDEREKNLLEENLRKAQFPPVLEDMKDSYKYLPSPTRSDKGFPDALQLGNERGGVHDPAPQFDFTHYRQHDPDFNAIQGLDSQNKEVPSVPGFPETAQRRPSSSYVPDFLPPPMGVNAAGPPSVSSSYSTHSNPVIQNQNDLGSYGASTVAGLPNYPHTPAPPSSSYMSPTSSSFPGTPITSTSYSDTQQRIPSANARTDPYRDSSATTTTTSSASYSSPYPSRDLFSHRYFTDPSLPLPGVASQQDPHSLGYPSQQSSLQALQRSSADFLQRASATALPGMNYPSVTESLARLSQTTSQQPWIGHDDRSRHWAQPSPILMPQDIDSNRNPFTSARPELGSLDTATKRSDPPFPGVPQTAGGTSDRYDVASAYMGAGHFNPGAAASNYSKSLSANPQKQLEEAYRHSAMNDYRSLSHAAAPSMSDMYSRMGMNPSLALDKYYPYSRATEAMYRSQQLGSNPLMPQGIGGTQAPYGDRDYPRNPYAAAAQDSAYGKYLSGSNLGQPLPPSLQGAGDYFQPRPGAPDPSIYDPYRRSVIHNMMRGYF